MKDTSIFAEAGSMPSWPSRGATTPRAYASTEGGSCMELSPDGPREGPGLHLRSFRLLIDRGSCCERRDPTNPHFVHG